MNPFHKLYEECNVHQDVIEEYPTIIDVELTNACNFNCVFCPTGNHAMDRQTGLMDTVTMSALLAEIAMIESRDIGIRMIGWGEPMMNEHFLSFVDACGMAGVYTHCNTNGSLLGDTVAYEDVVAVGLDSIKFSFQGVTRHGYKQARQKDYYYDLLDKILELRAARERLKSPIPWIQVSTTTTNEHVDDIESFKEVFGAAADEVSVGKTIFGFFDEKKASMDQRAQRDFELLKAKSVPEAELKHPDPCPEVWNKLTIAWDGSARNCCNDFDGITNLGNIKVNSIKQMWRHPTIQKYRHHLAQKDYSLPLCRKCFDYAELTEGVKNASKGTNDRPNEEVHGSDEGRDTGQGHDGRRLLHGP